jgi:hypothetical protein
MQPITLHHRLRACGIDPDASAWRLWRQQGPDEGNRRAYVQRMLLLLVTALPFLTLLLIVSLWLAGIPIDLLGVARVVAMVVAIQLFLFRVPFYPFEVILQTVLYNGSSTVVVH